MGRRWNPAEGNLSGTWTRHLPDITVNSSWCSSSLLHHGTPCPHAFSSWSTNVESSEVHPFTYTASAFLLTHCLEWFCYKICQEPWAETTIDFWKCVVFLDITFFSDWKLHKVFVKSKFGSNLWSFPNYQSPAGETPCRTRLRQSNIVHWGRFLGRTKAWSLTTTPRWIVVI